MYIIVNCSACGRIVMANTVNKTRSCPHCGMTIQLFGARVLARRKTIREAVAMIQQLKSQKGKGEHPVTFKKFKPR